MLIYSWVGGFGCLDSRYTIIYKPPFICIKDVGILYKLWSFGGLGGLVSFKMNIVDLGKKCTKYNAL